GAQPAAARDVHASDAGTVQRKKKNPERERLERIHMWSERLQQDGLGGGDAIVLGQAFANTGVSIVTLQQFAPLLNQAWTAGELVTLIRKFVGADGGRALEDWVAFAIRRPDDPDAVAAAVRVGQVDWANAAAVFNTHNDRYRRTLLNLAGQQTLWILQGGVAAQATVALLDTDRVYRVTGGGGPFVVRGDLADLLVRDSLYTVTPSGYTRYAPVNLIEVPNQVNFQAARHFCYLADGSDAYDAVMGSDDSEVTVTGVENGEVVFDIAGEEHRAAIAPANGDTPFDFDYDASDGSISHGHPGHAVHNLQ
ncbi:MAG: hypothetical protein Q8M79_07465, partial [Dehalococcoidia bacterium]|nr:hypothetical protein [Dehalococcoidia bacterium]